MLVSGSSEAHRADSGGRRNTGVEGWCDGGSAAFGSSLTGKVEVSGAASCSAAGASASVLGVHRRGSVERGRGDGGWGVAASRNPLVPRGGWDGTVASVPLVQAALGAVSDVCRAGGDRAVAGARSWRAGDRTSLGTGGIDDLARAAAQRGDAGRQPGLPGDDRAVACGAGGASSEGGEACDELGAARLCTRTARRCCCGSWRWRGARACGALEGTPAWSSSEPSMGSGVKFRSRSLSVCGSTTLTMRRCGSVTRRSTKRSTFRAGARCGAELSACLRTGRALRVPRARTLGRGKSFVTHEVLISERPAEADDRAVPGHWEGDLILGLGSSAIGTLVERTTRFTMLLHLPPMAGHGAQAREKNGPALAGHGAEAVRDAIARTITTLPEQLRRSLTWDQGAEMAQHARVRIDTALRSTLRPAQPVAARDEREHQRSAATVLPERNRSQRPQRERSGRGGCSPQWPAAKDPAVENAG